MISTILVPLDGSPLAEQALPHACRLASTTGAGLVLVRAAPHVAIAGAPASPLRVTVREAEAYLAVLRQRLAGEGFAVSTVALHDTALHAITHTARTSGAEIIVISTHGRTGVGRTMLGSVADEVLRHTTLPVLLVRAAEAPAAPGRGPYGRILVPLDGTALGETALGYLARGELGRAGEVVALRAISPDAGSLVYGMPGYAARQARADEQARAEATTYLDRVVEAHLPGWTYRAEVLMDTPDGAIQAAALEGIDLVVMATHGRTGLGRLAYGSIAERVLRHATAPVLLLHGVQAATPVPTPEPVRAGSGPRTEPTVPAFPIARQADVVPVGHEHDPQ